MTITIGSGTINKNRTIKHVVNNSVYLYIYSYIHTYKTAIKTSCLIYRRFFFVKNLVATKNWKSFAAYLQSAACGKHSLLQVLMCAAANAITFPSSSQYKL
jgi:hypothetical protein